MLIRQIELTSKSAIWGARPIVWTVVELPSDARVLGVSDVVVLDVLSHADEAADGRRRHFGVVRAGEVPDVIGLCEFIGSAQGYFVFEMVGLTGPALTGQP